MSESARIDPREARGREAGPPIKVPPPLLYFVVFVAGVGLRSVAPGDALPAAAATPARWVGTALALCGLALSLSGVGTFVRAKTTTLPFKAPSRLVTHGPYRLTRNPMYLGLAALYTGLALVLNRLWPLVLLPVALLVLIRTVILIEERYLEGHFGDEYRAYRGRVRRFL
jgi:protein-S-isoprenylcysteine O-methyltransferase Ste14